MGRGRPPSRRQRPAAAQAVRSSSPLFSGTDLLALVRAARRACAVRKHRLLALRALRHVDRLDLEVGCAAAVATHAARTLLRNTHGDAPYSLDFDLSLSSPAQRGSGTWRSHPQSRSLRFAPQTEHSPLHASLHTG